MKKKNYNLIINVSCIIILVLILSNKTLVFNTVSNSIKIWYYSIFPSLFPFFVLSDILINYDITNYIPKPIKKLGRKIFKTNDNVITIFFLSLISGFPSNARNTRTLYDKNYININEANYALTFTHFSNPLFILGTLTVFYLKNETYGYIILTSHYISNIVVGILLRNFYNTTNTNYTIPIKKCQNFPNTLINAIKSSIDSLLLILGTLTSFLILSSLIVNTLNLNTYNEAILKGILEITMGLQNLCILNIPNIYKVVISTMFISFGGLSVHMQVISQIVNTKISYKSFLLGRIYQTIISGILSYIIFIIIY